MASFPELQRRLAAEFQAEGWPWELNIGPGIIRQVEQTGTTDGDNLIDAVPADYLQRHGIRRERMIAVLNRAIGGSEIQPDDPPTRTYVVNNTQHIIKIGKGAEVSNSNLNVGGQQVIVRSDTDRDDVLGMIAALVQAGLNGDWNGTAARDLAPVVDARDDITVDDVREIVSKIGEEQRPSQGRVRALLDQLAVGAASGVLSTGVTAGLGGLLG